MKKFALFAMIGFVASFSAAVAFSNLSGQDGMSGYLQTVVKNELNCVEKRSAAKTFEVKSAFDAVEIESISSDILIEFHNEMSVKFLGHEMSEDEAENFIKVENGLLKIGLKPAEEKDTNLQFEMQVREPFGVNIRNIPNKIILPRKILKLNVNTISGDIRIEENADLNAVLKLKTVSGDIRVKSSFAAADMATTSGDVNVKFDSNRKINLKYSTTSGDVNLRTQNGKLKETNEDQNEFDTDFKFERIINPQASGEVVALNVETVSGDLKMRPLNEENAEIEYNDSTQEKNKDTAMSNSENFTSRNYFVCNPKKWRF